MYKINKISGIPIISQVINLLDLNLIRRTAKLLESDKYYKTFTTEAHLKTMLYMVLSGCNSLREICGIFLACEGRINHLGMKYFPKRSTISDANRKRNSQVFGNIYMLLLNQYSKFLSDSRLNKSILKNLNIIDSTTIGLFSDILSGVGRNPLSGKKKGGIKMHTMINAAEDVPSLVIFTPAKVHDHNFLSNLELKKGSIIVFDKGYNDYSHFTKLGKDGISFVTRLKANADWNSVEEFDIKEESDNGILKDEKIQLKNKGEILNLRRIAYWSEKDKTTFRFITNNYTFTAEQVTEIYKRRWQIELLFKRLKQNFPLKYFLGETQNAIEIQIWTCLIAQILMLVIQKKAERKWAFSNLMSIVRFHLMTYIDLYKFLKSPESDYKYLSNRNEFQTILFDNT